MYRTERKIGGRKVCVLFAAAPFIRFFRLPGEYQCQQFGKKLLREGKTSVKQTFEDSLKGGVLHLEIDEQIVYNQLSKKRMTYGAFCLPAGI